MKACRRRAFGAIKRQGITRQGITQRRQRGKLTRDFALDERHLLFRRMKKLKKHPRPFMEIGKDAFYTSQKRNAMIGGTNFWKRSIQIRTNTSEKC
jgi:hypothetical protein